MSTIARLSKALVAALVSLLLAGALLAQPVVPPPPAPPLAPTAPIVEEPGPPILQFILAGGGLALILAILVMPTRKSHD